MAQTRRLLHDRKWSKSWDAVTIDFYYTQQRKQALNFHQYRRNFTSQFLKVTDTKKLHS
jgi:hypothetical protein